VAAPCFDKIRKYRELRLVTPHFDYSTMHHFASVLKICGRRKRTKRKNTCGMFFHMKKVNIFRKSVGYYNMVSV